MVAMAGICTRAIGSVANEQLNVAAFDVSRIAAWLLRQEGDRMLTRCLLVSLFTTVALATTGHPLSYPAATRDAVITAYHGVKVPDPYRWMEDIESPQPRAWVDAECKLSHV